MCCIGQLPLSSRWGRTGAACLGQTGTLDSLALVPDLFLAHPLIFSHRSSAFRQLLVALLAWIVLVLPCAGAFAGTDPVPSSGESAQRILSVHGENAPVPPLPDADSLSADAFSSDFSHDADKLLSFFYMHWDAPVISWAGVEFVALVPGPVFPFERPPRA